MEKDYIKVVCPYCGDEIDIPYVYDGTYEIVHKHGCMSTFYMAILDGRLHVHTTKEYLQEFLRLSNEVWRDA